MQSLCTVHRSQAPGKMHLVPREGSQSRVGWGEALREVRKRQESVVASSGFRSGDGSKGIMDEGCFFPGGAGPAGSFLFHASASSMPE
jgi:hypothetical protein